MKNNSIDIFENHSHSLNESGFLLFKFVININSILIVLIIVYLLYDSWWISKKDGKENNH